MEELLYGITCNFQEAAFFLRLLFFLHELFAVRGFDLSDERPGLVLKWLVLLCTEL